MICEGETNLVLSRVLPVYNQEVGLDKSRIEHDVAGAICRDPSRQYNLFAVSILDI